MAIIQNIVIDQGTTFELPISISDASGNPINLTEYIARAEMRRSYNSNVAINFTAIITDALEGEITLSLTPSQTSVIKSGRYVYDVEISDVTGYIGSNGYQGSQGINNRVIRVLEGIATVTPEVSR